MKLLNCLHMNYWFVQSHLNWREYWKVGEHLRKNPRRTTLKVLIVSGVARHCAFYIFAYTNKIKKVKNRIFVGVAKSVYNTATRSSFGLQFLESYKSPCNFHAWDKTTKTGIPFLLYWLEEIFCYMLPLAYHYSCGLSL